MTDKTITVTFDASFARVERRLIYANAGGAFGALVGCGTLMLLSGKPLEWDGLLAMTALLMFAHAMRLAVHAWSTRRPLSITKDVSDA